MKRSIKTILALFLTIAMLAAFFVTGFATGDIKGDVNPDKPEIAGGIPSLPGHGNNTNQPEYGDLPVDEDTDGRMVVTIPYHMVTVTAEPADGGTVNGAGTFEFGNTVTVFSEANDGYVFAGWFHGEEKISDEPTYTFMLVEDTELTAKFKLKTKIRFHSSGTNELTLTLDKTEAFMNMIFVETENGTPVNCPRASVSLMDNGVRAGSVWERSVGSFMMYLNNIYGAVIDDFTLGAHALVFSYEGDDTYAPAKGFVYLTITSADVQAFEEAKAAKIEEARALAQDGDSEVCRKIVADAVAAMEALVYDESLSAEENLTAIAAAATGVEAALEAQRVADAEPSEQVDESGDCPYCGKTHTGKHAKWTKLVHLVLAFFLNVVRIVKK